MFERIFGSWKSSTWGVLVAAFFGFVLFAPQYFPPALKDVAAFVALGGAAGLGLWAKDPRGGAK